jgi:hypothetical protein
MMDRQTQTDVLTPHPILFIKNQTISCSTNTLLALLATVDSSGREGTVEDYYYVEVDGAALSLAPFRLLFSRPLVEFRLDDVPVLPLVTD